MMKNNINKRKKVRSRRNKKKTVVAAEEGKYVTMGEFKEWTAEWLCEYMANNTQVPHVISGYFPFWEFMRAIVNQQMYMKGESIEQMKAVFYKVMLLLYWGALNSDECDQQSPCLHHNFRDVIQHGMQFLSESGNGEIERQNHE